jgi:hypothetical protein
MRYRYLRFKLDELSTQTVEHIYFETNYTATVRFLSLMNRWFEAVA